MVKDKIQEAYEKSILEAKEKLSDKDKTEWYRKIRYDLFQVSTQLEMFVRSVDGPEKNKLRQIEKDIDKARKTLFDLM